MPLAPEDLTQLNTRIRDRYPVLLESAAEASPLNRYDLLLAGPAERLTLAADGRLEGPSSVTAATKFLPALDRWWRTERRSERIGVPFAGGWFLYLGYELAAEVEPTLELPPGELPRAIAWRMHGAIVFDRQTGAAWLAAETPHAARLEARLERDLERLRTDDARGESQHAAIELPIDEERPERYLAGVEAALEAIARGDVYQANLSRRWRARLARGVDASAVYRRLRRANPAPFAGVAHLPGFSVLSSSPERLLKIESGSASTRPIAGTRPRGQTRTSDESLRTELRLNEKEQAEHVMLVDLERNDLGRICRAGTVRVDEYMTIESYAHVHHIVSNVRGELRADVTPGQAIAAVFPGGTITGCPKIRCIQLLAELEREPREAYTGSMGYLRLDGDLDLNILIRTITVSGDALEFRTGAGIVADSRPAAELEETRAKARGLLRALGAPG
ncbi:MAG TPA: aminodeoxychorismate synthase component I [Nannocystaceae bacterium]|nr:aminodeoxychorismate synthase component I [Nannocystaceae bacterium]